MPFDPRRRLLLGVAAVCMFLVLLAGAALVIARQSLLSGVAEMRAAEADLRAPGAQTYSSATLARAEREVSSAHHNFQIAHILLTPISPAVEHLSWVPRIGGELSAAPGIARTADRLSAGVLSLVRGINPVLDAWGKDPPGERPTVSSLLGVVAGQRSTYRAACGQLSQAQAARRSVAGSPSGAVASGLRTLDRQLPRLLGACRSLSLLPQLLGYHQARTYFIAYQNPDMLRPTGGFIGSVALVKIQDGKMAEHFEGTWLKDNLSVPPPEPMLLYNREPGWLLRDANWSPDFPTSAALERFFLRLDLHRDVAGVVNLTPAAAAEILKATGRLYVPEYHRWVTSDNVAYLADYYAHWATNTGPYRYRNADTQRKQFIGIVAHDLVQRLSSLSLTQMVRLSAAISTAVARRDILLNFPDPKEQALVRAIGADGAVNATSSDYLYVVDSNLAYDKLNPFIHLSYHDAVQVRPDRWLHNTLTITVDNHQPPARFKKQGWYGPGAGRLGEWDDYATFLRVYVPAGAELIDQSGWTQPWSPGPAYGKTMFSGYLIVRHGQRRTIHLSYVVPPNVFAPSAGQRYHLFVQHQPGSRPDLVSVSIAHDGTTSSRTVRHPQRDFQVTVGVAVRPFHPIPLPHQPPEVVAPGHWIEPHTYLSAPRGNS